MAEKIVSPGVFTRERDLSFLPQGIAEIGGAIVGPFKKGPAFYPTIVETQSEFERIFGTPDGTYYAPYAVQSYLREAGLVTIVRVGGLGGYTQSDAQLLRVSSSAGEYIFGTLHNSKQGGSALTGFSGSVLSQNGTTQNFLISSGSWAYSGSISTGSSNYITDVFGTDALGSRDAYVYKHFANVLGANFQSGAVTIDILGSVDQIFTQDVTYASTPWVRSQLVGNERFDLFRFHTIGDGNAANTEVKISIQDVKAAGTIQGSDYGTFTVVVRAYSDTDSRLNILETFQGLTLDPTSPNYITRVIGDRDFTIDSEGKITESGNWKNNSNYIRVEVKDAGEYPIAAIPVALAEYTNPILTGGNDTLVPPVVFTTSSADDSTTYSGVNFAWLDNRQYNAPVPTGASTGSNTIFCLDSLGTGESGTAVGLDLSLTTAAERAKRKFTFGFQGGFDGVAPNVPINIEANITSTNSQGLDLSSSTASGSVAYIRALNTLSNADEWDINLIVMPGVIRRLHSAVVTKGIDVCEARGDCFYIADFNAQNDTITQAITQADAVDSNYVATWYPWVKIVDTNTNQLIGVPPSVVLPGIFAANDRIAAEWYAPAGLNRGGITQAVQVVNRLTHAERDDLYESNVNPIAAFPGQGISVWGQKTLQKRPSALDRINVRRLLIGLKKFIASTSRFLVFEQNTTQTRNRFLNIVNPYLEQVQQRQGLYAFRVVMDETNNTPDIIDRNILYGQIFIQPAKTAEFIVIDFNVLPTGASFDQ